MRKLNGGWIIVGVILLLTHGVFSQAHRVKAENFFGLQFKPLIPFHLVGDKVLHLNTPYFNSTVSPAFGYSYGGVVRVGFTKLLALETGLDYTRRNFNVKYSIPDSNVSASDHVGYVTLNLPVSCLVYIRLGEQFYMNVSGGVTTNFNVSNVRSQVNAGGMNLFSFEGKRLHYFNFEANANVGFEFRTRKSGIFYLGISTRIPFSETFYVATDYTYDTFHSVAYGLVKGATFALNIKYFFHNVKRLSHKQPVEDIIEQ